MERAYDGLTAYKIPYNRSDIVTASTGCLAMIQLELENGICISPGTIQQIEYVGDKKP